jgi:hypothetical protein
MAHVLRLDYSWIVHSAVVEAVSPHLTSPHYHTVHLEIRNPTVDMTKLQ